MALPIHTKAFPGLCGRLLSRRLTYLDNACLTPTPGTVAKAVEAFYRRAPACLLRSPSRESKHLKDVVGQAREAIRRHVKAQFSDEIVFAPNATYAINLVAGAFRDRPGAVLISDAEHNSNRLPWLNQQRLELAWPPGQPFPLDAYRELLSQDVKLVSLASVSHVTGAGIPVSEVVEAAHDRGIPVHIDAAQQVTRRTIDIEADGPDFLSFSLHKAYGPSGLGVLYVHRKHQADFQCQLWGGGTVDHHADDDIVFTKGASRFEFGLQNYAAISAVDACMEFLGKISARQVEEHFRELHVAARESLAGVEGLHFIESDSGTRSSHICNFHVDGVDGRHLAETLSEVLNVSVRGGVMCANHYYGRYGIPPSVRLSFGYHNTREEVCRLGQLLPAVVNEYLGRRDAR
jgi:cysteine desulfurase/selenocysteine lyase